MPEGWTLIAKGVDTNCQRGGHKVPEGQTQIARWLDTNCQKGGHIARGVELTARGVDTKSQKGVATKLCSSTILCDSENLTLTNQIALFLTALP